VGEVYDLVAANGCAAIRRIEEAIGYGDARVQ
jgi:hypothetical protein